MEKSMQNKMSAYLTINYGSNSVFLYGIIKN